MNFDYNFTVLSHDMYLIIPIFDETTRARPTVGVNHAVESVDSEKYKYKCNTVYF